MARAAIGVADADCKKSAGRSPNGSRDVAHGAVVESEVAGRGDVSLFLRGVSCAWRQIRRSSRARLARGNRATGHDVQIAELPQKSGRPGPCR